VLFGITSVVNIMYGWQEMKELCAEGPHEYFSSWRNWLDIAQFLNVLMIGPLALAGSSLAKVTASIGMLLMLPKMAQAHVATNVCLH
jgi:hypothetical protein